MVALIERHKMFVFSCLAVKWEQNEQFVATTKHHYIYGQHFKTKMAMAADFKADKGKCNTSDQCES